METELYIALLNPSIAVILAAAFLVLWLYQPRQRYLLFLPLAYTSCAAGFLLQYFTLPIGFDATKLASNALFLAAALCIAHAILGRYGRRLPVFAFLLGAGGIAGFAWFLLVRPDLTWRILVMNFALGGISLLVAAELRAVRQKNPLDRLLFLLALLSGLNFFVRTIVIVRLHGAYDSYDGFYDSAYWTTVLLSHAIFSLVIAFTLMTGSVLDLIAELRRESRTDPLSGLLNRRGFEVRAASMMADAVRSGMPLSLVICDLDNFKAVNDSLGHVAGDKVIASFARFLDGALAPGQLAGRIGGEEFAVMLPGADLSSARLFAEGARSSFGMLAIDGLPRERRFTASFGVAQLEPGESITGLIVRADAALYDAKNEGRDCVRVAGAEPAVLLAAVGA